MSFQEKVGLFFTIMFLLLVLGLIVFSKNGILDYTSLAKEKAAVVRENERIRKRNQILVQQIHRLRNDPEYIRHVAKHDLGMTAADDVVFKLINHGIENDGGDRENR